MFHELLTAATATTGFFGGLATYIALKAFKRNREASLLLASLGFTLITAGTVLGGLVYVFFTHNQIEVYLAQSAMVAAGFFSIVYSISKLNHLTKA